MNNLSHIGTVKVGNKTIRALCKPKMKWDEDLFKWREVREEDVGTAFSVVILDRDLGQDVNNPQFEYFILINGMREKDYSKSGSNTAWGIKEVLNDLDQRSGRYRVYSILLDNDAPSEEQSKLLARYMDRITNNKESCRTNLLGLSKGGRMAAKQLKYLKIPDIYAGKMNASAYSMTGLGTLYASPVKFYKRLYEIADQIRDSLVEKLIPILKKEIKPQFEKGEDMSEKGFSIVARLIKIHQFYLGNNNLGFDIAEDEESIPIEYRNPRYYDKDYLIFTDDELTAIEKYGFTNISNYCTPDTWKNGIRDRNILMILLYLSDKIIFGDEVISDGVVQLESQVYIEKLAKEKGLKNVRTIQFAGGCHDIGTDINRLHKVINQVLSREKKPIDINDTIEERH